MSALKNIFHRNWVKKEIQARESEERKAYQDAIHKFVPFGFDVKKAMNGDVLIIEPESGSFFTIFYQTVNHVTCMEDIEQLVNNAIRSIYDSIPPELPKKVDK